MPNVKHIDDDIARYLSHMAYVSYQMEVERGCSLDSFCGHLLTCDPLLIIVAFIVSERHLSATLLAALAFFALSIVLALVASLRRNYRVLGSPQELHDFVSQIQTDTPFLSSAEIAEHACASLQPAYESSKENHDRICTLLRVSLALAFAGIAAVVLAVLI